MTQSTYYPDFEASCRICGASPCVVVAKHSMSNTDLCGPHFFDSVDMIDWQNWNETTQEIKDDYEDQDDSEDTDSDP
jgi:hypothetical protein